MTLPAAHLRTIEIPRLMRLVRGTIYVPFALVVDGEIIQVFDTRLVHEQDRGNPPAMFFPEGGEPRPAEDGARLLLTRRLRRRVCAQARTLGAKVRHGLPDDRLDMI